MVKEGMMKKLFFFSLIVSFVVLSTTAFAAEKVSLGSCNVALKVDYINFTDSAFDDHDLDEGYYIGLEAYGEVLSNLYLGGEVGYANSDGDVEWEDVDFDTEATFVPIELNLKYAFEVAPNFVIDAGGGVSYSYAEFEEKSTLSSFDEDDWLFGGQIFVDLNYTINQFFIGVNAKHRWTEEFKDYDFDYDSWIVGGQVGMKF